jgi:hypothetical protein
MQEEKGEVSSLGGVETLVSSSAGLDNGSEPEELAGLGGRRQGKD